jgi:hypothetical protein
MERGTSVGIVLKMLESCENRVAGGRQGRRARQLEEGFPGTSEKFRTLDHIAFVN